MYHNKGNAVTTMSLDAPPFLHAVGGSLGSAIALLLFYPLERARVELQTTHGKCNAEQVSSSTPLPPQDINDRVNPLQAVEKQGTPRSSAGAVVSDLSIEHTVNKRIPAENKSTKSVSGGEVLSEIGNNEKQKTHVDSFQHGTSISAASSNEVLETASLSLSSTQITCKNKLGLLACIYQLRQRKQLYSGVKPVVTTLAISNFIFFYCHSFLKQFMLSSTLQQRGGSKSSTKTLHLSLLASSLAGMLNVLLTNPLWVANLRIVTAGNNNSHNKQQNHRSLWREVKDIIQTEGWEHLWNGTPASLLLVSNPVIQFVAYEHLKNRLLSIIHKSDINGGNSGIIGGVKRSGLKPLEAFLLGAIAKAISTVLTYPLQLAQTVLRVQKQDLKIASKERNTETASNVIESGKDIEASKCRNRQPTYKSTVDCLLRIYQHKGIEGWFAGMRTKLLQTVLTAAFTFLTYEQIIRVILAAHQSLLHKRDCKHKNH